VIQDHDTAESATESAACRWVRVDQVVLWVNASRSGADDQVFRIKQQRAGLPCRGARICGAAISQGAFAGHFDEAASAARRAAVRRQRAVEMCVLVRPDYDVAAVPFSERIGPDGCRPGHGHCLSVDHVARGAFQWDGFEIRPTWAAAYLDGAA